MKENFEYQIFIGCSDSQSKNEIVSEEELREMVIAFFEREQMDFSILSANGGYIQNDGHFVMENTLCVDIIGASDLNIFRLAKNLSMFMNQECSLVIRSALESKFY